MAWQSLFNATMGYKWKSCNDQKSYQDPCTHCGRVVCETQDGFHRIKSLQLNNGLVGHIPDNIALMTELEHLVLSDNRLSSIPALFSLSKLRHLAFHNSHLEGTIPEELGSLTNLEFLILSNNKLNGSIPVSLGNLKKIKRLDVDTNQLTGSIPESLGMLTQAQAIVLFSNRLTGTIPEMFTHLSQLSVFRADRNELSGTLPKTLSHCTEMVFLRLHANLISGTIPKDYGKLQKLGFVTIDDNLLQGTIPESFSELSALREFVFSSNFLSGTLPSSFGNITSLLKLELDNNYLSGSIPKEFGHLSNLQLLYLSNNYLTGSIPRQIGQLKQLRELILSNNSLTGSIPQEMGDLPMLLHIYLDNNLLQGFIPSSLGRLSRLQVLDFKFNFLNGSVPASLGNLTHLIGLDLSHNSLEGGFPVEWGDLHPFWSSIYPYSKMSLFSPHFPNLQFFRACCNHLNTSLVNIISPLLSLRSLSHLDVSLNSIHGPLEIWNGILEWFWYQEVVESMYFVPQRGLRSLVSLDVSFNEIEGQLPQQLPQSLIVLNIRANHLSGVISGAYDQLITLQGQGNNLHGSQLPAFLKPNGIWTSLYFEYYQQHDSPYDMAGVLCQGVESASSVSTKVFDIDPTYDSFFRCTCRPGYYGDRNKCTPASPGYYVSLQGERKQYPCTPGTFSSTYASRNCIQCPIGTYNLAGRTSCTPCPLNGATCDGGIISLKPNHWIPYSSLLGTNSSEYIYPCLNPFACKVNGTSTFCSVESGYNPSTVLCSECIEGYFSNDRWFKTCEKCSSGVFIFNAVLSGFFFFFFLSIIISVTLKKSRSSSSSLYRQTQNGNLETEHDPNVIHDRSNKLKCFKSVTRILVGHAQVLLLLSDLSMRGPKLFHEAVSASVGASIPTMSFVSLKCLLNFDFKTTIYIAAFTPLILAAVILPVSAFVILLYKAKWTLFFRSCLTTLTFFLYLTHPSIIKQLMQAQHFHITKIDGNNYLQSDMRISSSSEDYGDIQRVSIPALVFYTFLLPVIAIMTIVCHSGRLGSTRNRLIDPDFEGEFGFLYSGYRIQGWMFLWETVIYLRKFVLLVVTVFMGHDQFMQSYVTSFMFIASLSVQIYFQPYRHKELNSIETKSLCILSFTQLVLVVSSHHNLYDIQIFGQSGFSIALLLINAVFFLNSIRIVNQMNGLLNTINRVNSRSNRIEPQPFNCSPVRPNQTQSLAENMEGESKIVEMDDFGFKLLQMLQKHEYNGRLRIPDKELNDLTSTAISFVESLRSANDRSISSCENVKTTQNDPQNHHATIEKDCNLCKEGKNDEEKEDTCIKVDRSTGQDNVNERELADSEAKKSRVNTLIPETSMGHSESFSGQECSTARTNSVAISSGELASTTVSLNSPVNMILERKPHQLPPLESPLRQKIHQRIVFDQPSQS